MGDSVSVQTELLTLEKIYTENYQFSIPSYQRPYVWSDDNVLLLFRDIKEACRLNEPNYFIGTILSSRIQQDGERIYELIDGQQRTTTLMLMTIAFKYAGIDSDLTNLAVYKTKDAKIKPRLQFEIRDQIQQLLGGLAGLKDYEIPSKETIAKNDYLKQIDVGLEVLIQEVKKLKVDSEVSAERLGDYLYRQVQWVNNIVPTQMDLNRLFATMNTAGIQLEQADILKAKLFKHLLTDKAQYDAIWVACEHLEDYFERNVRKVFPTAHWNDIKPEQLAYFDSKRFCNDQDNKKNPVSLGWSIAQLAEQIKTEHISDGIEQDKFETYEFDIETVYCRPIIKFPLLLIHAYRVYLALHDNVDITPRLHSDRLLEVFEPLINGSEDSVKQFIEILWQVRYQFDRWVIKWVERDDTEEDDKTLLGLTYQSRSQSNGTYYINRTQKELTDIVLLQSVRNFTGERSAQYWLTPFITGVISKNIQQESDALTLLENIDNQLSLAIDTQKEASFAMAKDHQPNCLTWEAQVAYFKNPLGTSFEHYWFQKLEYVLWKKCKSEETSLTKEELNKFKNYRITSKNSVEHVHPQNEEYKNALERNVLDSFGNLVLLTPRENSSYSHQAVAKKKVDFEMKPKFDALKLREIFNLYDTQGNWSEAEIKVHKNNMLTLLAIHYKQEKR